MSTATNHANQMQTMVTERALIIERTFDAPRALDFHAWSDFKHLCYRWGQKDWTLHVSEMDFRVGGSWRYSMKGPDGMEGWGHAYYREIVPPERIVYLDTFVYADDQPVEGMQPLTVTVKFFDLGGGKTRIKSHCEAI